MIRFNGKVFDETISVGATYYTSVIWDDVLGESDRLAIFAVGKAGGSPAHYVTIAIEQSSDGVSWVQKNAVPEINNATIGTSESPIYGSDRFASMPSADFVRLRISVGSGLVFLKVYVTIRDLAPASTEISMLMAVLTAHVRGEVMADLVRVEKRLKKLDRTTRRRLLRLFREAPRAARGGHRLAWIFENLALHTARALRELVPHAVRFIVNAVTDLAHYAARLLGIQASLEELAALAFGEALAAAAQSRLPVEATPEPSAAKPANDDGAVLEDWADDTIGAGFSPVDDVDEIPWDDGAASYTGSEMRAGTQLGVEDDSSSPVYTPPPTHHRGRRGRYVRPANTPAHQEVDHELRSLSPTTDGTILELLYGLLMGKDILPELNQTTHHGPKLKCPPIS
jgi:hypothetical protein